MKNSQALILIAVLIVIGIFAAVVLKKDPKVANTTPTNNTPTQTESIAGCYVAGTDKDVFTLNIQAQTGENVVGKLSFKNFEKDSSSGTFSGTYRNGILLGNYSFQSEGMDSVMQVIFKKVGNDFVRGYGDVDVENGTTFTDLNNITYDSSSNLSVFKKGACI